MQVNYFDVKSYVSPQDTCEDLLSKLENVVAGDVMASRYDVICSLFNQRRSLKLKNKEIVKFINKFKPKYFVVYKLLLDEKLVYVGSSTSIETRIIAHTKDKEFNHAFVCTKNTKTEMLELEHSLIRQHNPEYNKSLNTKHADNYNSVVDDEAFIRIEDFIVELPVRKNSGNALYSLFSGSSFKYPYGKLTGGGKHKITSYFIQEGNEVFWHYKPDVPKEEPDYVANETVTDTGIISALEEHNLMLYCKPDTPSYNNYLFDNTYIITDRKWRVVGKGKWYTIHKSEHLIKILKEHLDNKSVNLDIDHEPVFPFGKYKNKKVSYVESVDPKYILWCKDNMSKGVVDSLGLLDTTSVFDSVYERMMKR